jgi:hypothetical protein
MALEKELDSINDVLCGGNPHTFVPSILERLATWCYEANKAKGFYQDEDLVEDLRQFAKDSGCDGPGSTFHKAADRIEELFRAVKTCLIADEAFEALREHRRREPDAKYFRELGDVIIRCMSEFGKANVDPLPILMDILRSNLAREFKHGNRRY